MTLVSIQDRVTNIRFTLLTETTRTIKQNTCPMVLMILDIRQQMARAPNTNEVSSTIVPAQCLEKAAFDGAEGVGGVVSGRTEMKHDGFHEWHN